MGSPRRIPSILSISLYGDHPTAKLSTLYPMSRVITWWYCKRITINRPKINAIPANCIKSNDRFQTKRCAVKRWKTCVTGIAANNLPGNSPMTRNKTKETKIGTHRVCHVNKAFNEAPERSSISNLKVNNRTVTNNKESNINSADSYRNIR